MTNFCASQTFSWFLPDHTTSGPRVPPHLHNSDGISTSQELHMCAPPPFCALCPAATSPAGPVRLDRHTSQLFPSRGRLRHNGKRRATRWCLRLLAWGEARVTLRCEVMLLFLERQLDRFSASLGRFGIVDSSLFFGRSCRRIGYVAWRQKKRAPLRGNCCVAVGFGSL